MPSLVQCPDEGALRAYLDRQLPAGEQAEVEQHLAQCAACAQAAAGLAAQADGVYAALDRVTVPQPATAAAWQRFAAQRAVLATPHGAGFLSYLLRILSWRLRAMSHTSRIRWQPALAGIVLAALLISVIAVAPLRAAAAQFLDIFRVQKLAVVQVNTGQIERLESYRNQIFSEPKVDKAPAIDVTSAGQASQRAGFQVLSPEFVPSGMAAKKMVVEPGGHAQTTVNLQAARSMLQMAGLPTDAIPANRDSMNVSADIKPTVSMHYQAPDGKSVTVVQGRSPDVQVPDGVDLSRVGEVGLQLLGMSPEAAHDFSSKVDWATTLVLPIPRDMASVQEVRVRGTTGYFIAGTPKTAEKAGPSSALIWQEKGLLYMVAGEFGQPVLQHVAESLK